MISIALFGAYLNSKQDIRGFILWIVTNIYFSAYNFYNHEWAQGCLFGAYLLIAINGLITWRKDARQKS
jgi:nicotinamide riboside transporter PnuC